jgi:HK97 family phage major capsid protein
MNVEQLKRNRSAIVQEMRGIQAAVDARSDQMITSEESAKFSELRGKVEAIDANIANAEFLAKQEAEVALRADPVQSQERAKSFGEFIQRFLKDPSSPRVDTRDMTMGNPVSAGLAVPPEFENFIRSLDPSSGAIVRPRATVLSGGASPDAVFKITSLNQGGANGQFGGVTMKWAGENTTRESAGDLKLQDISLEPQNLVAYLDISKQLLENASAIGTFSETQLKSAGILAEETAFIKGSGLGMPTGFLGHPASVTVARATAGTIGYDDILNMVAKSYGTGNSYVFVASRTAQPTLSKIRDGAGNNIWAFGGQAIQGAPPTLYGIPVFFSELLNSVGTSGDIVLVDLSRYIIRDGSSPRIFLDPFSRAVNNVSRIYVSWNVDGKPWLTSPVTCADGVQRSPFVQLS